MFKSLANAIRFLSIAQVNTAGGGHLGLPLGMADCITTLFKNFLVFDTENPEWPNRDRFVLSAGHGSAMLYAILHLVGYNGITMNDMKNFRRLGSRAHGYPEYAPKFGIESTTGLPGQGLANAVGMAIEERLLNVRCGDDCINHYTYVCAGNSDLMEGVTHESSAIAGHLSLGKLILLFDDNGVTIDGRVDVCVSEDILQRYESYGWQVLSAADGHCEYSVSQAIQSAQNDPRPSIIACKTKIGLGTRHEGNPSAHCGVLSSKELDEVQKKFGWEYDLFEIPEYIEKLWRSIGKRHNNVSAQWFQDNAEKYGRNQFECTDEIKKVFRSLKKDFFVSRPFESTKITSQRIIEKLVKASDLFVSGSCDLGSSTGCLTNAMFPITKSDFSGDYIHYGAREPAMGSIMNGIAAGKKIRCFGGTFLALSDNMRTSIRMSALMNVPTIFVFTHDSIGIGEDGPVYQPVEHLPSLRAVPNLNVFRPADATETVECWECAIKSERPSVIVLTCQDVRTMRFSGKQNLCSYGGYLINEDSTSGDAMVTLIATGSEVGIAEEAKVFLVKKNISVNVASIPCWNLFDAQPERYKKHVLGNGLRVGIEASNGFGWEKYLERNGLFCGVSTFGKSASASDNYEHFGLTSETICSKILAHLTLKCNCVSFFNGPNA